MREQIAEFVGIVVGVELRHLRAVGDPAIAAIDWTAHDQPWDGPPEESGEILELHKATVSSYLRNSPIVVKDQPHVS